jgi:hypothetical protein
MVSKKKFLTPIKSIRKSQAPGQVLERAEDNPESLLLCGVCPLLDTLGSSMMQKTLSCQPPSSPFQVGDNGSPQSMASSETNSSSSSRRNRSQSCPHFTLSLPTEKNIKRSYNNVVASNDTNSSVSLSPQGNSLTATCTSSIPSTLRTCLRVSSLVDDNEMRSLHSILSNETASPRLSNRFRSKMSFFKFKIPIPKNQRSAALMDESSVSETSSKYSMEERDDRECSPDGEEERERKQPRSSLSIKMKAPKPLNPWSVVKTLNSIRNKAPTMQSDGSTVVSSEMEEGGDRAAGRDNWAGGDQDDSILFRQSGPNKSAFTADAGPSLPGSDIDDSEILSDQENQYSRSRYFAPRRANDALLDAASQLLIKQKMLWTNMTK